MNKKYVFITGASGGIGTEILKTYLNSGYYCFCISSKKNTQLEKLKRKYKSRITIFVINFYSSHWSKQIVKETQKIQRIDTLINCAGINIIKNINFVSHHDFNKILSVNFESYYFVIKILLSKLEKSKYPRIINVSSIWSIISKSRRSLYSSTKGAINSLTRSLSLELSKKNVLVNSVSPGFILTNLTKKSLSATDIIKIKKEIPLNRLGKPKEVADLIFYLGSEKNTYITGQNIVCDGGFSIK